MIAGIRSLILAGILNEIVYINNIWIFNHSCSKSKQHSYYRLSLPGFPIPSLFCKKNHMNTDDLWSLRSF
jgi:hypothetical protein